MQNDSIKGVIFDMDGVIVDSEPIIFKAAVEMFRQHGVEIQTEDCFPFIGTGESRFIAGIAEKYGCEVDVQQSKEEMYDIYLELINGNLKPLPGVFEFIEKCRSMGLKLAVASSADIRKVKGNLQEIGLDINRFDAVVSGEDVEHKKPSPDIFLLAASKIGVDPAKCLVVEDAVSGVTAAKAAGAKCLAITSSFSEDDLEEADFTATNLATAPSQVLEW